MLPAQKGDVIHNIIVFARAIVFRQILIAPQLRECTHLNRREAAQLRIRHARVDAVTAQRCVDVVYVIDAMMLIPAEPQIVYPSGIRCPGPAHGDELGPELCSISKLRLCESRGCYALGESSSVSKKVRSGQRVMVTQMVINLAEDVINTDDIGEAIVLGAAVGTVGPVKRQ